MGGLGQGWDIPVESNPWSDFHWWKVVPGKLLQLIILSEVPLWYAGHFHKGRMRPCYGEGCLWCEENIGAQVRYIMAAVERSTRLVGLLEVSRSVGLVMRGEADAITGVRGLAFELGKETAAKQSRMEIVLLAPPDEDWWKSVPVPSLRDALSATWRKGGMALPQGFRPESRVSPTLEGPGPLEAPHYALPSDALKRRRG